MEKNILKSSFYILCMSVLFSSCISTTVIESIPSGAEVYLNGQKVGVTPYSMTDAKIIGTCTHVELYKEGFEPIYTNICRNEQLDMGAVVGGIFFTVPFLWTLKYDPFHVYELYPEIDQNQLDIHQNQTQNSKIDKLKELNQLLDEKLITEQEYQDLRKKILEE